MTDCPGGSFVSDPVTVSVTWLRLSFWSQHCDPEQTRLHNISKKSIVTAVFTFACRTQQQTHECVPILIIPHRGLFTRGGLKAWNCSWLVTCTRWPPHPLIQIRNKWRLSESGGFKWATHPSTGACFIWNEAQPWSSVGDLEEMLTVTKGVIMQAFWTII